MMEAKILDYLAWEMLRFNRMDPARMQHLLKVHDFTRMIGQGEQLDEHTQFVAECAALVHDIGIRPAEEKYGASDGKLQEQEGPSHARVLLEKLGLEGADIDRICYLVGHHHTYTGIDGLDYQILVEADFLVNFYEDSLPLEAIQSAYARIFRTKTGKELCRLSYPVEKEEPNAGTDRQKYQTSLAYQRSGRLRKSSAFGHDPGFFPSAV